MANNTTVAFEDYMDNVALRVVFISAYAVVFALGVSGNALVVYVVSRNPSMQTITNVFIANLAASDIMMCLLAVPFTPISGLLKAWPFGDALCHIVPMTLGVSVYVSTLTSIAIAVDRYCVIVHPFLRRMRVAACLVLVAAIWLVSVSISLPLALYQNLVWIADGEFYSCQETWPGPGSRRFFTIISLILQFIVPCLIITYCYASVSDALRRRARLKIGSTGNGRRPTATAAAGDVTDPSGSAANSELRNRMKLRRKRRTNRMLIAMVAIFVVCWLPLNVILLTLEYDEALGASPYFLLVFFVAHVIAMSSTVYNPFLYAWMNDNFRKEFRRVLPCLGAIAACRPCVGGDGGDVADATRAHATAADRDRAHRSPSLYSTLACRTDPATTAAGDRRCTSSPRGRATPTSFVGLTACSVYRADEQTVRFIDASTADDDANATRLSSPDGVAASIIINVPTSALQLKQRSPD